MTKAEHILQAAAPAPRVPNGTTPVGDAPAADAPAAGALPDTALDAVGGGQGILKLARDLYDLAVHGRER